MISPAFSVQGNNLSDAKEKMIKLFGPKAIITNQKTVRKPGFLGIGTREFIELEGYVPSFTSSPKSPLPLNPDEERRKILAQSPVSSSVIMEKVLKEISQLHATIAATTALAPPSRHTEVQNEHPNIAKIDSCLASNEFSLELREALQSHLRRNFSIEALDDMASLTEQTLDWIADKITIWKPPSQNSPRIICLVGPTGVGKTTTLAKLAARLFLGTEDGKRHNVRLISIDNYRIGARDQIESYGGIMSIPVSFAETGDALEGLVKQYKKTDCILIDTVGRSPRNPEELAAMQSLLDHCGVEKEVFLVLMASTRKSDMKYILRQFGPFGYSAVILSKLDETEVIGHALSALHEDGKAIAYLTNSQRVPVGIERAEHKRLLMYLKDFDIDRQWLEKHFQNS